MYLYLFRIDRTFLVFEFIVCHSFRTTNLSKVRLGNQTNIVTEIVANYVLSIICHAVTNRFCENST